MWTSRTKYPNLSSSKTHFNIAFECGKKCYFIPLKWSRSGCNWWSRSETAFTSLQLLSMNLSCLGRPYAFSQPFEYSCNLKKNKKNNNLSDCLMRAHPRVSTLSGWLQLCGGSHAPKPYSINAWDLQWMRWGNHLMLCWKTTKPACFKSTNSRWWCSLILTVRRTDYYYFTFYCLICFSVSSQCRMSAEQDSSRTGPQRSVPLKGIFSHLATVKCVVFRSWGQKCYLLSQRLDKNKISVIATWKCDA